VLPLPAAEVFLDLVLIFVAVVPLGLSILRLGERLLRSRVILSTPERLLLAFYASGAVLFILASIPIAFYGYPLLITILVGGAVAYAVIAYSERGLGIRKAFSFICTAPGGLLGALTIGMLAVEVDGVASLPLTNMMDGSFHSLFVNLLISGHTLPWTYGSYATVGVTYPQGAPVWMSIPVLLFGWPIVSAPLDLPPLFLALSTVAAFCLGQRLTTGSSKTPESWVGLLFAAFFGLVFTWPRLWVGGSFDFAFGLPLFVLLIGWLVPVVRASNSGWKWPLALGIVVGVECSLSLMLGITALLLLAGYILAFRARSGHELRSWVFRWLTIVGICAGFLVRSLVGFVVWFGYPTHVLAPVGSPPLPSSGLSRPLTLGDLNGELNPFVLFKPKVSPIPVLSVEITALLATGLVLIGLLLIFPTNRVREYLPRQLVLPIAVGTAVAFVETAAILVADAATPTTSGVSSITYVEEASAVLFLFFELIAILPLFAATAFVSSHLSRRRTLVSPNREPTLRPPDAHRPRRLPSLKVVLVMLLLFVPLASGIGATAVVIPGYISNHIHELANVSTSDIAVLEWAGSHLPTCSRVLVAPGSVGQYLPEFADVGLVYPSFPNPENLSYSLVVQDLDLGNYTNSTRVLLLQLGVTEVFVSGQNSVSFPPFQLGTMTSSPDFEGLEAMGDVTILEFLPGATLAGCIA
jgi:hypothetical protein